MNTHENKRKAVAVAAAVVATSIAVAPTSGVTDTSPVGDALFGKAFRSGPVVIKNGERHRLVKRTRIRLKLRHERRRDVATWRAGCNFFGGRVKVRPRRLKIGRGAGTAIGCSPERHRQDRWVGRFFHSDPRWRKVGRRLRLRSGDDVIVLRRRN